MNLFTLSIRNLQRKPLRALIFSLVFTAGVAAMVGLHYVSKDIGHSMEEKLSRFGANIVIMPQEDSHHVSYGGIQLGALSYTVNYLDEAELVHMVRHIEFSKNISAVAPKLIETAIYNGTPLILAGVDWPEELFLNPVWNVAYEDAERPLFTAAGSEIAGTLGISAGDTLIVNGQQLIVDHILNATGSETDKLVFTSLKNLQTMSGRDNMVNFIEVAALCSGCPIEDIVAQISAGTDAQVKALQSVVKQRMYAIDFVETLVLCIVIMILTTSVLMMALLMLSAVNERKKEIGIMRAAGYSKPSIFIIISAEAAFIAFISGVLGYFAGFWASRKILAVMEITMEHSGIPLGGFFLTAAGSTLIAVIAASIPALKAARLTPSEALNRL